MGEQNKTKKVTDVLKHIHFVTSQSSCVYTYMISHSENFIDWKDLMKNHL